MDVEGKKVRYEQDIDSAQRHLEALSVLLKGKKPANCIEEATETMTTIEIYEMMNNLFYNEAYSSSEMAIILEEELIERGFKYAAMPDGFAWLFKTE